MTRDALRAVGRTALAACGLGAVFIAGCATHWVEYRAPDGSFSARFPDQAPKVRPQGAGGRTDYSVFADENTFTIQVFEGDQYRADQAAVLLQDYPSPAASGVDGRIVSSSRLQLAGHPGREVRIEGTANGAFVVLVARAVVADHRLFLASVATAPGRTLSPDMAEFLASFEISR